MTADNWEPSEEWKPTGEMVDVAWLAAVRGKKPFKGLDFVAAIKAVRPLLIAEARPQIEAEERERIAGIVEDLYDKMGQAAADIAYEIRALKDSKP